MEHGRPPDGGTGIAGCSPRAPGREARAWSTKRLRAQAFTVAAINPDHSATRTSDHRQRKRAGDLSVTDGLRALPLRRCRHRRGRRPRVPTRRARMFRRLRSATRRRHSLSLSRPRSGPAASSGSTPGRMVGDRTQTPEREWTDQDRARDQWCVRLSDHARRRRSGAGAGGGRRGGHRGRASPRPNADRPARGRLARAAHPPPRFIPDRPPSRSATRRRPFPVPPRRPQREDVPSCAGSARHSPGRCRRAWPRPAHHTSSHTPPRRDRTPARPDRVPLTTSPHPQADPPAHRSGPIRPA